MSVITITKRLRIGFWGKIDLTQPQSAGDAIVFSDSIALRVIVKIQDVLGIKDTNPVLQFLSDVLVFFEEISAWVKGAMKTIFITDDRYFRKRG